ncbi:MAG: DUF6105 family protein [Rhizobiaceae bacterium]|nr:DUF6105 family protein [Rhizobiaceae bacterium]
MRIVIILWMIPLVLFWGWYFLSANDMHFGYFFLTRGFHDHLFEIYGKILFLPPEDVPVALAWIFFIDTLIVFFGVAAVRWYKLWLPQTYAFLKGLVTGKKPTVSEKDAQDMPEKHTLSSTPDLIGPMQPAE